MIDIQRTLYRSRNPTRRWLHRARFERIERELRRAGTQPGINRVLDVGPGAGPYLPLLCELFDEVVALDIEPELLGYVDAAHGGLPNLTLVEDDIAASRLEPGGFDLVLCSEVIEHTPDPAAVIHGIVRQLRPGGILVLSTPQPYSTVELLSRIAFRPGVIRLVRWIYKEPIEPTGHISLISRGKLGRLLESSGLRVRTTSLTGLYLPVMAEVGGEPALRIERRLAPRLERGLMSGMLWTQHWTAERP